MDAKVLVLDIETAPILAYVWDRHDQNIAINQIKDDWFIMSWAAKWLDSPISEVIYRDQRNVRPLSNDKKLVQELWELLDQADIVITQNGKAFDAPKINARFQLHGLMPPAPYKHLDTYIIAKKSAAHTAHSLEYLTDKLCTKYKKLTHKKFPGMSLWTECLKGNKAAWEEMKRYNIHDVLATEELYNKLKAWAPKASPSLYSQNCPVCGNAKYEKRGFEVLQSAKYQRLHCLVCGRWFRGEKVK